MDKCRITKPRRPRAGDGSIQIRISGEIYDQIVDISADTGRSICNVASTLLAFALERVEIIEE